MRSIIVIILLLTVNLLAAQVSPEKINFSDNETCCFSFSTEIPSKKAAASLVSDLIKLNECYHAFVDYDRSELLVIARKTADTDKMLSLMTEKNISADFNNQKPLTLNEMVDLYCSFSSFKSDNQMPEGYPRFIDTRNPEKDKYLYIMIKQAWENNNILKP